MVLGFSKFKVLFGHLVKKNEKKKINNVILVNPPQEVKSTILDVKSPH